MALDAEIAVFENAMQNNPVGPAHDPNWVLTKALLETVRVQGDQVMRLTRQVTDSDAATTQVFNALRASIRKTAGMQVPASSITDADVTTARDALNQAIQAARSGQQVAQFAGKILQFAVKFIV